MGPTEANEVSPSDGHSTADLGQQTQTMAESVEENVTDERPDKDVCNPLESTHLNGSFQDVCPLTFDLPTIPEHQFEDYGQADSPSFKRSSPTRALGSWRSACDLSCFDGEGEGSCSSCSDSSDKLSFLEDRLAEMEGDGLKREEAARRQKNVNKRLIKRINSLEERLQVEKIASEEALRKQRSLHEVASQKAERKLESQVENLNTSVRMLQEENSRLSRKLAELTTHNRALEKKARSLDNEMLEMEDSLERVQDHARKLEETVIRERRARETEKEAMTQIIEGLRSQVPDLWGEEVYTAEELRWRAQFNAGPEPRAEESRKETEKVAEENRRLREQIEELQAALSAQGKDLLWQQSGALGSPVAGSDFCSLVDEMELSSREQLRALQEQKDINRQLRQYLDRVILSILEKDPGLLEVKKPSM